ncbi:putative Two-component system protein A [Glarea lozoyensis 74030]|uniref:Putative Two-component system protein A n=1 Tax=Glarea lozoyensis (strain ATCC 74030 / MF5533) TaxID=1104152 RepID=H0EEF2_GLAL7|nr:putative Two-component system protein A [Glarea lozoyensis 74030]
MFEKETLRYISIEFQETISDDQMQQANNQLDTNDTYRMLVQTVKDYAIFMLDTKGNVKTWNQGAALLKGYTAEEIIGKHFSTFYTREDLVAEKPRKEIEICLRDGKVEDESWRLRRDGSRFWANVILTSVYRNGVHIGFSKVTRDLTERKAAESRLVSAYEEAAKLKSEFLANMTHEIRTPMHGMLSALTLLTDTSLLPEQRELTGIIEESGNVLLDVINDILDWTVLTKALASTTISPVDPRELLSEIAPSKRLLLAEDNLINQKVMVKMLRGLGFEHIHTALDGAQAVQLAKQHSLLLDVILMDISMPILDGMEATVEIRRAGGDREIYLAKGMNGYVSKPVDRQKLADVLLRWLKCD